MSKKTLLIVGIIIILGGFAARLILQKINSAPYDLTAVTRGDITQEVSASGKVASPTKVDLQFKNSGEIIFLKAEVGQKVTQGDVLAKQNIDLMNAQLRQLQAALKNQEYKLKSREDNNVDNYDDKYDIKAQKALVGQARADVEAQESKISEAILATPLTGSVVSINSEIGEIAKPETIVASIISDEKLQIDVDVAETNIANVEVGQPVKITLDAFDETIEWSGTVTEIDSTETIKGGAVYYKTTVSFDTEDSKIKSGMTANVWIKTATAKNVLSVPVSALQKNNNPNIIKVLQGDQVLEKEVVTGLKNDTGMVEIISGLSPDDQVIIGNKK